MLIKKENKNQITCRVSKEELSARGFDSLEDLMHDQVQARKLLDEVIEEARETVHFSVESGQVNVQMIGLSDGSVTIKLYTDKKSAIRSMLEKYKAISDWDSDPKTAEEDGPKEADPYEGVEIDTIAPRFEGKQNLTLLSGEKLDERLSSISDEDPVMLPVAVSFDQISDAISLCRRIGGTNGDSVSDLYKMDGRYYLTMDLSDTKKTLGSSVFAIAEYSLRVETRGDIIGLLREHGQPVIEGNAVQVLSSL